MFPIPFNKPYRKPDGTLTTIGEAIASGGGGGGGTDGVYVGETDPDNEVGEDGDFYLKIKKDYPSIEIIPKVENNDNVIFSNQWTGGAGNAWHLFDQNNNSYWSTEEGKNKNQYCGYDLGENGAIAANKVGINPRRWSTSMQIQNFKIQASNNNTDWDDLYTGIMPNDNDHAGIMNYFLFDNETAYRYYRLYVIDAYQSQTITVFGMQLYALDETQDPTNVVVIDTYIKSSGEWVETNGG